MIYHSHDLPIARQAKILNISCGSVYYESRPMSAADVTITRWIDEPHLNYPFVDSRMLRDALRRERVLIGRRYVVTSNRRMGALLSQSGTAWLAWA
jgi:putative transposase